MKIDGRRYVYKPLDAGFSHEKEFVFGVSPHSKLVDYSGAESVPVLIDWYLVFYKGNIVEDGRNIKRGRFIVYLCCRNSS